MTSATTPFKMGSLTNYVLKYAAMNKRTYITVDGVFHIFGHKAEKPSRVLRSINVLCSHDLMVKVGEGKWRITPNGLSLLWSIADKRKKVEDD